MKPHRRSPACLALGIFFVLATGLLPGGAQSVIMPSIATELDGWTYYSLVFTVGTLSTAILTPAAAKISEYWGRQRMIRTGLFLLLISNIALPFCPAMFWVVLSRFLSGVGSALVTAPGLALIGSLFPLDQRVRWMGYYGMLSAACNGFGPIWGGLCAGLLGWRWVYFSAVPLGLIGLFLLRCHAMPEHPAPGREQSAFDLRGLLLLGTAMAVMTALCQWGGTAFSWASIPAVGLFLATAVLLGCFVFVEFRQNQNALLPIALFLSPPPAPAFSPPSLPLQHSPICPCACKPFWGYPPPSPRLRSLRNFSPQWRSALSWGGSWQKPAVTGLYP